MGEYPSEEVIKATLSSKGGYEVVPETVFNGAIELWWDRSRVEEVGELIKEAVS